MRIILQVSCISLLILSRINASENADSTRVGIVTASALNKRSCPSDTCKVVGKLFKGDKVKLLEVVGNWGRVTNNNELVEPEWVYLSYVSLAGHESNVTEQSDFTVVGFFLIIPIGLFIVWKRYRKRKEKKMFENIHREGEKLITLIEKNFLVKECSKCHETEMALMSITPNSKSVEYQCTHCDKKNRAQPSSEQATMAAHRYNSFLMLIDEFHHSFPKKNITGRLLFTVPDEPRPYEKTTREPIPEAMRNENWRRDQGKCVSCESQQNLEFDHIIPVSKGGATTVRNLQLLCRQCNREKSNKI